MAQVLIRRLDEKIVRLLKKNAKAAGRSLEEECRLALERVAKADSLIADLRRKVRAGEEGEEGTPEPRPE